MASLLDLLMLFGGLGLLLVGGDLLVRGAVALANRLGVPTLVIGLTVVAFGTSTPELVVNLIAAIRGDAEVGFGNVVGSNIANLALLLGITALVRPLIVQEIIIRREVPMMLLTCVAALVLAEDQLLVNRPDNRFDRDDGMVLLLLFGIYLYYLIGDALRPNVSCLDPAEPGDGRSTPSSPLWRSCGLVLIGLALLMVGGQLTVRGATDLALAAGIPEVVVSLTLVAVGTSLPELITSLAAARRGESDLAIGNLVGSNIYNLTFVFGLTASIASIPVPAGGIVDLIVMLAISSLLLPLAMSQRRISRGEGLGLLVLYVGYVSWLVIR